MRLDPSYQTTRDHIAKKAISAIRAAASEYMRLCNIATDAERRDVEGMLVATHPAKWSTSAADYEARELAKARAAEMQPEFF